MRGQTSPHVRVDHFGVTQLFDEHLTDTCKDALTKLEDAEDHPGPHTGNEDITCKKEHKKCTVSGKCGSLQVTSAKCFPSKECVDDNIEKGLKENPNCELKTFSCVKGTGEADSDEEEEEEDPDEAEADSDEAEHDGSEEADHDGSEEADHDSD